MPLPGTGPITPGFLYAHAIAAGPDGNVWFTNYYRSTIVRVAPNGTVKEFSLPSNAYPSGLTVGPDQNIWFLTTGDLRGIGRMSISGSFTHFPVDATSFLCGIAAGPDGNLWFTEASLMQEATGGEPTVVGKISQSGTIMQFPLPADTSATGIIASAEGNMWFVFSNLNFRGSASGIERISLQGTMNAVVDIGGLGSLVAISSITQGPDGNAWCTAYNNTVSKVTPGGVITQYSLPTANAGPFDITTGPDGNLWFTERNGNNIGRITPQGVITEFPVPTANSGPAGICVGPDGNIWFTEDKANQVGRLLLPSASCTEDSLVMCLVGGRYKVTSYWRDQYTDGATASLSQTRLTDAIGAFWLFNEDTFEYLIGINTATDNGRAWISIASFTDVEFWVTVQDTVNGQAQIYHSLPGNRTSIYDPYFFVYP
jgi:streptogramin lyase